MVRAIGLFDYDSLDEVPCPYLKELDSQYDCTRFNINDIESRGGEYICNGCRILEDLLDKPEEVALD